MGQKVNPIGLRVGVNKDWEANWFAEKKDFGTLLNKDDKIRKYLASKMKDAAVASVVIERTAKRTDVKIYTARPGIIIGQGGKDIENLRNELKREVNSMLPDNMVADIKAQEVTPKKVVNNNISVIHEKNKKSIVPIIASCVASVIICLAVFLPIAIQNEKDYKNYVANQREQQQIEQQIEESDNK